jgi:hypothetical protein
VTRLHLNDAVSEVLFASSLQPSDAPTAEAVTAAIGCTMRQLGPACCASRVAQEFGDHPQDAADRMRWVQQLLVELCGCMFFPAAVTSATPALETGLLPVRTAA